VIAVDDGGDDMAVMFGMYELLVDVGVLVSFRVEVVVVSGVVS